MPIRQIKFEIECGQCKKKAELTDSIISTYDGIPWGNVEQMAENMRAQIPVGWISMEWLHRPENSSAYYGGKKDGKDFCSITCLIAYWHKIRNKVKKSLELK